MTDRTLTILIVTVIILVLGGLGFRAWLKRSEPAPEVIEVPVTAPDETHTGARARVVSCKRDQNRSQVRMEGYIENVGNVDLHYVTVKSIWKDTAGTVIVTDTLYALNNEVLAPGGRKPFMDVSERYGVARCNAETIDFW